MVGGNARDLTDSHDNFEVGRDFGELYVDFPGGFGYKNNDGNSIYEGA